tara:strand:+ start:216 stop:500 length:285 start_codon:yes stop_codon:yes gene_type:complete
MGYIIKWYEKQIIQFEKSRYGAMAMMITVQSCWGSIAAGLSYNNPDMTNLIICATLTMLNNAILIAQGPAKFCVGIFSLATVANTAIILIELLF